MEHRSNPNTYCSACCATQPRRRPSGPLRSHGIKLVETRETIVNLLRETPAPAGGASVVTGERVTLVLRLGEDLEQLASDLAIARERLRRVATALEALGRDMKRE